MYKLMKAEHSSITTLNFDRNQWFSQEWKSFSPPKFKSVPKIIQYTILTHTCLLSTVLSIYPFNLYWKSSCAAESSAVSPPAQNKPPVWTSSITPGFLQSKGVARPLRCTHTNLSSICAWAHPSPKAQLFWLVCSLRTVPRLWYA